MQTFTDLFQVYKGDSLCGRTEKIHNYRIIFFPFLIVSAKHYGKQFLGQIVQVNLTDKSLFKMTSLGP